MACRYASAVDEYHGWKCAETEGACVFFIPDEKKCYEEYGEGPLSFEEQDRDLADMSQGKPCIMNIFEKPESECEKS